METKMAPSVAHEIGLQDAVRVDISQHAFEAVADFQPGAAFGHEHEQDGAVVETLASES
jgi:hypothetical protein